MTNQQVSKEYLEKIEAKFYTDKSKCAYLRAKTKDNIEFSSHGNTYFNNSLVYIEEPRSWC